MPFTLSGAAGKKNRQKERRLMKGFNLSSGGAGGAAASGGAASSGNQPTNGGHASVEHAGSAPGELGLLANLARNRTEAEVNATSAGGDQAGVGGGGMGLLRKSPMTKLVRLAKLAASSKAWSAKCMGRSSKQLFCMYQAKVWTLRRGYFGTSIDCKLFYVEESSLKGSTESTSCMEVAFHPKIRTAKENMTILHFIIGRC